MRLHCVETKGPPEFSSGKIVGSVRWVSETASALQAPVPQPLDASESVASSVDARLRRPPPLRPPASAGQHHELWRASPPAPHLRPAALQLVVAAVALLVALALLAPLLPLALLAPPLLPLASLVPLVSLALAAAVV